MNAAITSRVGSRFGMARARKQRFCPMEPLESRTLLSAAWSTIFNDPAYDRVSKLTADRKGNVYALGRDANYFPVVLEKASGSAQWTQIFKSTGLTAEAITTDAAGDLFVGGYLGVSSNATWSIIERRAGQTSFATIDSLAGKPSGCFALATDSAGDVFAGGYDSLTTTTTVKSGRKTTTTTSATYYTTLRKLTPNATGYSASNVYHQVSGPAGANVVLHDITVIESGSAAGIYASGAASGGGGQAIKSTDGGATWTIFGPPHGYQKIVGDLSGNLYISGWASGTDVEQTWTVRESSDGGATWSIVDDFVYPGSTWTRPSTIGTDLQGNVYVVGEEMTQGVSLDGIIRTNEGGSWHTVDDFTHDATTGYVAFTVDSNGTLYAGGQLVDPSAPNGDEALIRSAPGPTAPATPAAIAPTMFSSMTIGDSTSIRRRPVDDIFAAVN